MVGNGIFPGRGIFPTRDGTTSSRLRERRVRFDESGKPFRPSNKTEEGEANSFGLLLKRVNPFSGDVSTRDKGWGKAAGHNGHIRWGVRENPTTPHHFDYKQVAVGRF